MHRRLLIVQFLMVASCQTPLSQPTFLAHGRTYCSIHRVPLVTARLFEPSPTLLIHCGDERCAECGERFPNSIDIRYSRHRNSVDRYAANVAYCPECEAAFREMRRPSRSIGPNQALERTADRQETHDNMTTDHRSQASLALANGG